MKWRTNTEQTPAVPPYIIREYPIEVVIDGVKHSLVYSKTIVQTFAVRPTTKGDLVASKSMKSESFLSDVLYCNVCGVLKGLNGSVGTQLYEMHGMGPGWVLYE